MQPQVDPFSALAPRRLVLLVSHEFAPFRGGVATYVQGIAEAAERLGLPVAVWTVDYRGRVAKDGGGGNVDVNQSWGGPPVVRLSSSGRLTPGGLLSLTWGLWRRRTEWRDQPIVLLSVGAQMAFFLLALVGCRTKGRVTCFFHGSEVLRFTRNPVWRRLAKRFYRKEASVFGVTTRYVEGLLRDSGLLPREAEIGLAACALPTAFHVEQTGEAPTDGPLEAIKMDQWRVLTVARIHPRKGQLEVARALALLSEEQRARIVYQMVGVGGAGYRRKVEAACREGGVHCEFLGALDDRELGTVYARATVYTQASRTMPQSVEGFGITFLEASSHGCPVTAWRSGGVAEAVLDGETGLLVEEGDVAGLAGAVGRLLGDVSLRTRLGETGKVFSQQFSWLPSARILYDATCMPRAGKR